MKKVFVVSNDNVWHMSIDNYYVVPVQNKNIGFCLNTYYEKLEKEITLAYFKDMNDLSNVLQALDNNIEMNFAQTIDSNEFADYINGVSQDKSSPDANNGEDK